jgi:glycosyltransferase involved in cell wall biosynthesis
MRIIQVNKFLHPQGGADKYFLTLTSELANLGHDIIPFGMNDDRNIKSPWSKYFSENINYHHQGNLLKKSSRLIWNKEAAVKFAKLLDETKPDLIHCHNIYHQLSPSILVEAKKRNIPVVMTIHDYKLICPNYLLFSHGQICQRCVGKSPWHCLSHNCYNSYSRSGLAALESWLHNKVWHVYRDNVDLFIAPSQFLKNKMISGGFADNTITVLENPAPSLDFSQESGQRLLYFGRLFPEKGVNTLIEALKDTEEQLDIVGTGPEETNLKELVAKLNLNNRVTFHGGKQGAELYSFIKQAKAVIVPSLWYENMSLVILESLAQGKLIIASDLGGNPELIEEGKTGWLFPAGDVIALTLKIKILNTITPEQKTTIQNNIKEKIEPLNLKYHLKRLEDLYQNLLSKRENR